MSVVELKEISCEKQNRQLFTRLNLDIEQGELVFLRGENGAGKTSLLRILVGLSQPQDGCVLFCGDTLDPSDERMKSLIYVGHKPGNNPTLSAITNLQFWAAQRELDVSENEIVDVLELLQLEGLEDSPTRFLSAGQQRRVALARLWLQKDAKLWVLDEPFTALDINTVDMLCKHIGQFVTNGGAVIMTSHQAASITCPQREFILEYSW